MGKTIEAQAAENRRGCCAYGYGGRVEEIGSDEDDDSDTQGVGLSTGSNTRFVSDSLHFTGIDLGDRESGTSRRGLLKGSEEDEDEDSSSEEDDYEEELAKLPPKHREEALVQIALQRIERAKARGRTDVNLSKEELTALERRRKRLEEEAARKNERKKRKEQRIAVPLTHLEPISRKKKGIQQAPASHPPRQDSLPRHPSSNSNLGDAQDRQGFPPMGYFPPPTASRTRPRSGTASSQRPPSRAREDQRNTPWDYMQGSPVNRGASDSMTGPRSAMGPVEQPWIPNISPNASPSAGRQALDPFQFQVAGPRAPMQPGAAAASRRHVSGPAEMAYMAQRRAAPPAAARSRQGSRRLTPDEETSEEESEEEEDEDDEDEEEEEEEEEESSSDDPSSGAQIRQPHRRRQPEVIVVEDPEPEPEPVRKIASPVTRRPVGGKRRRRG